MELSTDATAFGILVVGLGALILGLVMSSLMRKEETPKECELHDWSLNFKDQLECIKCGFIPWYAFKKRDDE